MKLSIIVAVAADNAIGKENDLLWHLPADLKRFKETTTGHTIIMGRNTFYSLPKGALPNRRNIIISTTLKEVPNAECYASIEQALYALTEEEEVFVIGGAQLYRTTLPWADRLYFTRVSASFDEADTFFPEVDFTEWKPVFTQHFEADERNAYATTLTIYDRIPYFKKLLTK
ncbi:dihydrofolate reductase [Porphyromonas circumdentaria]|uniref:Dihydrofolate reductase n=1 Tax=Porphyromonas circumdentaria TaxID=29524 RepID=A0A1T4MGP6_9PORP|nr:dihydrofolate reductase [Porphyromonas circumdentaria]MBB6275763.1 dihydrofolate reductase [Porphyromonas circumdentaria]MDO4721732.1 dihydrofolate reductase [Porphyromonas circumdentaria]SJZ66047.1 dihydrofolate reductase [Porphyromonas circumdentaria]